MQLSATLHSGLRLGALGLLWLLLAPADEARSFSTLGGDLSAESLRHFRVHDNFQDAASNDNTTPEPNFPGWVGVELAFWKAIAEWGSGPFGDGTGDPLGGNVLGSGGANFDAFFSGNAGSGGGNNDNVVEALAMGQGCNPGVIAFVTIPIGDGWSMKFCDGSFLFHDGPGDNPSGFDIQGIATHEYGHALGLGHTSVPGSTMFPVISGGGSLGWRSIEADDIAGVQFIYGVAASTKPRVDAVQVAGSQVTVTGVNFSATDNQVWFTADAASPAREDPRLILDGVASSAGGTQIVVTAPAGAASGNVAVKQDGTGHATLSNAFPVDLGNDGGVDPDANFTASPTEGNAPLDVAFTDRSTGTGLFAWSWDFGDGNTSTQASPNHTYLAAGTYDVTLSVNGAGGTDVEVQEELIVVTGFVPASCGDFNGSGTNPNVLTCQTDPVLGSTWIGEVDGSSLGATGTCALFGYEGSLPGLPTAFGELLVDPTSPFAVSTATLFFGGTATFAQDVPNDTGLNGTQVYLQSYMLGPRLLTNRLDLVLGF